MPNDVQYDLKSVKLPRVAGASLRLLVGLIESGATRWAIIGKLLGDAGITGWRRRVENSPPTFLPLAAPPEREAPAPEASTGATLRARGTRPRANGFAFATVDDYEAAYCTGLATPDEVARRVLDAIAESDRHEPPLRAFIASYRDDVLAQAAASAQRHREGKTLGPLDGVPVAIKDEVDMVPYPTTVGTRFLGRVPATEDSTVVARLRAAGALLIGKTNMHEIGIGTTGLNPHHGAARNPYHTAHHTGGSSSGSAAAVAAGLCPAALGADGGGSIRIPSAFCGLVGLKATFSRVSEFGAAPLAWSVAHLGPIAATARDAARLYSVIAGPDPKDPNGLRQPPVSLRDFENVDLDGLRLGVYWPWFNHASPAMVEGCAALLKRLEEMGARVVEIAIPELEAARLAHVVIITSEMAAALDPYHADHSHEYGLDVRISLGLARAFTARDYIRAQRIRTEAMANFSRALEQVDAIVTPATGMAAPAIPADALPDGDSDITTILEIMRFAFPANLTGLPAISFPAGYDANGLPVGMQAIGRYWEEHVLLRLAHAAEQVVERRAPRLHYQILPEDGGKAEG